MPPKARAVEANDSQNLRPRKRARLEHDVQVEDDAQSEEPVALQSVPPPVRQARPARVTRRRPVPSDAPATFTNPVAEAESARDRPPVEAAAGGETAPKPVRQARSTRTTRGATAQDPIVGSGNLGESRVTEPSSARDQEAESSGRASRPRPVKTTRTRNRKAASSGRSANSESDQQTQLVNVQSSVVSESQNGTRAARASRRKRPATAAPSDVHDLEDSVPSAASENANNDDHHAETTNQNPEDEEEAEAEGEEEEGEADDPEKHEVDTKTLSMYDLSHEGRYGKTSERERKMAQIDWTAVKKKRQEEAEAIMYGRVGKDKLGNDIVPTTEEDAEGGGSAAAEPVTRGVAGGVGYRLVNGEIVEDVDSLTIDRAARVANEAAAADETVEEENDLTLRLNRTTYLNARKRDETERVPFGRGKSDAWSDEDTDKFYDALTMFGTDFFIISKMFPPRTRKQIKLKFIREERLEPERINAALLGKKTGKIDLDHYAQAIDRDVDDFHKYDSLEHANQVIRESMKDKEEAMRAAVKEDEENNRQREVQRQQREKHRLETERKKEERARKKAARRSGNVWGTGTMGGADDDVAGTTVD